MQARTRFFVVGDLDVLRDLMDAMDRSRLCASYQIPANGKWIEIEVEGCQERSQIEGMIHSRNVIPLLSLT